MNPAAYGLPRSGPPIRLRAIETTTSRRADARCRFVLLFTTFNCVKQAALIYTGIPFAIVRDSADRPTRHRQCWR